MTIKKTIFVVCNESGIPVSGFFDQDEAVSYVQSNNIEWNLYEIPIECEVSLDLS